MSKSIDIFIKSHKPDFWLLQFALQSISKNITGYRNIILVIPEDQKHDFDTRYLPERTLIFYISEYGTGGWLYQQVCKLNAYKYSDADFIMYSDSDAFACNPINVQDLIVDDRPEILFTDYEQLPDAKIWQKPTELLLNDVIPWEYMRRLGLIYHRETLVNLNNWIPNLEDIIMKSERFSEFNLLGAFANKFENHKYRWVNTDNWSYVPPVFEQVWSHATKEEGAEELHLREMIRLLETVLRAFGVTIPY